MTCCPVRGRECIATLHAVRRSVRVLSVGATLGAAILTALSAQPAQAHVTTSPPAAIAPLPRERAVELALAHNQALRAARMGIDQARANEVTAALKPNPV